MNLLSCSPSDKTGIIAKFLNGKFMVVDRQERDQAIGIVSSCKRDGPYTLDSRVHRQDNSALDTVKTKSKPEGLDLWHRRLDHTDNATVWNMNRNVKGMNVNLSPSSEHCASCLEVKQKETASARRLIKRGVDHVIHSDTIGPVELKTFGKSKNIVTFIVGRSRFG